MLTAEKTRDVGKYNEEMEPILHLVGLFLIGTEHVYHSLYLPALSL